MLGVGVKLEATFTTGGEYLADVAALEAAGAHSIWLDVSVGTSAEPWILLGAISAVTHRVRLGVMVDLGGGWPPALDLLGRLSGGRLAVGVHQSPNLQEHIELLATTRSDAPAPTILIICDSYEEATRSLPVAGGFIFPGGGEDVPQLRAAGESEGNSETWVDIPIPKDRAAWARAIAAHAAAGATGILVPWDPRIIDLLRSAGEPDDRTDLLIATG